MATLTVYVEPTDVCNAKCQYCVHTTDESPHGRPKGFMELEIWKRVIEDLAAMKADGTITERIDFRPYWFGESFLHPEFDQMLKYAMQNDFLDEMLLATNGAHLDARYVEILLDWAEAHPKAQFFINYGIDALDEAGVNQVKRMKGSGQMLENIHSMLDARALRAVPNLHLIYQMVVMPENVGRSSDFVNHWESVLDGRGIGYVVGTDWSPYIHKDYVWLKSCVGADWQQDADELHRGACYTSGMTLMEQYPESPGPLKPAGPQERKPCGMAWQLTVCWDGRVTPCCIDTKCDLEIGNVHQQSLREIYTGKKALELRVAHLQGILEDYPRCDYCDCPYQNAFSGAHWLPDEKIAQTLKQAKKEGIKVQSRDLQNPAGGRTIRTAVCLVPVFDTNTPPLSLAYLKASLIQEGYECQCFDFTPRFRSLMACALGDKMAEAELESRPELVEEWATEIAKACPGVVGFTIYDSNIRNTEKVVTVLRQKCPGVLIVCGGPAVVQGHMNNILCCLEFADVVIEGEGEFVLPRIVDAIDRGEDPQTLSQVWSKDKDGNPVYSGSGQLGPIDEIPFPDFSDFSLDDYTFKGLPLLFSRGCILNCTFCTNKWNHKTQRTRSGKNAFEEVMRNYREFGIARFMMNDDSLISHLTFPELDAFADLLCSSPVQFSWSIYGTRIDRLLTQEFVYKLVKSGLEEVQLGVESFSTRVQKDMGKSSNLEMTNRVIHMFHKAGVRVRIWLIYGYPTETETDFEVGCEWLGENSGVLDHVSANCFSPNKKYLADRKGVVRDFDWEYWWTWSSDQVELEQRKERFFKLLELLDRERIRRGGEFSYLVGDPFYTQYLESWGPEESEQLKQAWRNELFKLGVSEIIV
ncbi:MAG: radical SAM protein [Candidatus Omnitrophica bacterium]|nr:radical SAM protein [Candidatus Omnitrophota bacterium]